jgi:general secretion pathway protein H
VIDGRRGRGFTLVEILVVLVIIALVGGLALVTLERDERRLAAREAKRFAGALEFAAARAQARNETLGVSGDRTIRFWRREPSGERWLPLDDDVLGARVLPEPLLATPLSYAGQRIAANTIVPLRASGRNEPFAFTLASPAWLVVLAADPLNRVSIDGPVPNNQ